MFNYFRKQPEKPKPDFLGEQHEHKACLIVFAGTKAEKNLDELKRQYAKSTIVQNKSSVRLKTMIKDCEQLTTHHQRLQSGCIGALTLARNLEEMFAMQMGLIPSGEMEGFSICPGCLQQAIVACEEVLNSLKDIEIATKEYV